jgi:hypothetical protein
MAVREVTLSEVWIVCTGSITGGAKRKIHADHPGTKVHFIDGDHLTSLVQRFVPTYWADVELPVNIHLSEVKKRSEDLDRTLDLIHVEGEPSISNKT